LEEDFEHKYLKEIAKVKSLESKISKLKSDYKELSKQVAQLNIQGFYEQIASLSSTLDDLNKRLQETDYQLAWHIIEQTRINSTLIAGKKLSPNTTPTFMDVRTHLLVEATRASGALDHSSEPLSIAKEYCNRIKEYSKRHHLGLWREE